MVLVNNNYYERKRTTPLANTTTRCTHRAGIIIISHIEEDETIQQAKEK